MYSTCRDRSYHILLVKEGGGGSLTLDIFALESHLPFGDRHLEPRDCGEVPVHPVTHKGGHGSSQGEGVVAVEIAEWGGNGENR